MNRMISQEGIKLLTELEGCKSEVYKDIGGLDTIGIGHLLTEDEVRSGSIYIGSEEIDCTNGLSYDYIIRLLRQDLRQAESVVNKEVRVPLSQNQFDALTSFVFNIGGGNFRSSTLLRNLNRGDYSGVPTQMKKWIKAGGKVSNGLINRREKEIHMWCK